MTGPYRESLGADGDVEPAVPRVLITDGPTRIVKISDDEFVIEIFSAETDTMGTISQRWRRQATITKPSEPIMERHYALNSELALWLARQLARCR